MSDCWREGAGIADVVAVVTDFSGNSEELLGRIKGSEMRQMGPFDRLIFVFIVKLTFNVIISKIY